ncbi:unnamed protein product [Eruca vesicaria subsp. sativa]|uniref:NYN domain-containing protein n=1 Tax=Eruca vesicaria subsp. sativa TaxID=29727 RepID=A0ABC8LLF2_ERUVS|nr:unnamed protein product [Eruca vesicaria subsp. sativa]
MTKGRNMTKTWVCWNIVDYPIPEGLNPTAVFKNTKSALENQGYYGDLFFTVYCDDKNWHELYPHYSRDEVGLQIVRDSLAVVDNMLVDILLWGVENPIPSNFVLITNNVSKETELFGVLEDLKSENYNILVAQFEEDASSGFVRIFTSVFDGGNPSDQKENSQGVTNKDFNREAKIGVFWNMEDCPIPKSLDPDKIYQNVKPALANQGCHGEVPIWAYCEKINNLSLADVTLVPVGDKSARFKKMLKDILFWARQNRGSYPSIIPDLMVISNITGNTVFVRVLNSLNSKYNVLLTLSDVGKYISDVWLHPSLMPNKSEYIGDEWPDPSLKGEGNPIDQRESSNGVEFNTVDYNFKSAIRNQGDYGEVLIKAYWDDTTANLETTGHNIQSVVIGNQNPYVELDTMFLDILLWAIDNPAPSNLMVISKSISKETELLSLLQHLDSRGYNILVAHAEEAASTVVPFSVSFEWVLKVLFSEGNPLTSATFFQGESSQGVHNEQMESSLKRKKWNEANTAVFWNIEDCPMPGGIDTHMFLQNIKSVLTNHSSHGNVSITAYYDNNRSLDDFSLSDNITLVHTGDKYARIKKMLKDILFWALESPKTSSMLVITRSITNKVCDVLIALSSRDYNFLFADPFMVSYVNNVWLLTSLFGGENPIDLCIERNFRKQIGALDSED